MIADIKTPTDDLERLSHLFNRVTAKLVSSRGKKIEVTDEQGFKYTCMGCGRPNNHWTYECGRAECDSDWQHDLRMDNDNE